MDEKKFEAVLPGMDTESVRVVERVVDVSIEPGSCMSVENAVDEHVKNLLLRHSDEFDGVPVSVSGIKLQQNREALIHPYFPYLQVKASAKFTVFSPSQGAKLVGVVKRITNDMICLSVLDSFPAVLHRADITKKLQVHGKGGWVSTADPTYKIGVNTSVVFTVKSVSSRGGLFSIIGSLKNLKREGRHDEVLKRNQVKDGKKKKREKKSDEEPNPRPKKRKKNSIENGAIQDVASNGVMDTPNSSKKSKEEHGVKTEEQTIKEEPETTFLENPTPNKKIKKGKKGDGKGAAKEYSNDDQKGKEKRKSDVGEIEKVTPSKKSQSKKGEKKKKSLSNDVKPAVDGVVVKKEEEKNASSVGKKRNRENAGLNSKDEKGKKKKSKKSSLTKS